MIDFTLPDFLKASIIVYCIRQVDDPDDPVSFEEQRVISFNLTNLGATNNEKLKTVTLFMDEFIEEISYITGYGIKKATVSTYHNQKNIHVFKREYDQFPPLHNHDIFMNTVEIILLTHNHCLIFPYSHKNTRFPLTQKVRYGHRLDYTSEPEIVQRFVSKFHEGGHITLYNNIQDILNFHRRETIRCLYMGFLPQSRQSPRPFVGGTRAYQKKVKKARLQKRQEEIRQQRIEGKSPAEKIYVIEMDQNRFKIGRSQRPKSRLRSLQTSNPHKLILLHTFPADSGKEAEEKLHRAFHTYRLEGEWFQFNLAQQQVLCTIREYKNGRFLAESEHEYIQILNSL